MPSFKNLSRQISNLSSASSTNPIDDALEKVGKKIKNWMLKSKEKVKEVGRDEKVKEVGRDMSEVVHRGGWKII
ncbi:unnamed protein product [Meloidogyne enterolobii]|uniref:Uncharacterized protein n=1 Tax=Meloidogyne enterolobii TaxID=390850 RepID=A0ACB1AZD3_MELEN